MSFESCWNFTLGIEKGFFNDPAGGPTRYGVTESVARANGYTGPMENLPLDKAKQIAKIEYFDRFQCDQLPEPLQLCVFDTAYNGGMPIKWLQLAVGVTPDGVMGAKTVAAARAADPAKSVAMFGVQRIRYMQSLKNFRENAGGWMLRVASMIEEALK